MTYLIIDAETTSLDPSINGRITCISTHNLDTNNVMSFYGDDESKILCDFWNYVEILKCPTLITFNGASFDIPYLVHRSVVCCQKIPKYNHQDLRLIVNSFFTSYNKLVKGNLGYWATILGIEQKTPPGIEMIALFLNGKYDEIKEHCEEDLKITTALFQRLQVCGLIGPIQKYNGKY